MTALGLRKAKQEDIKLLFDWRNDDEVRKNAFDSQALDWDKHVQWFKSKINDPACTIFILMEGKSPVGGIRFDIEDENGLKAAQVTINIDQQWRHKGYGTKGLKIATAHFLQETKVDKIVALIKKSNAASVQSFTKAGFLKHGVSTVKGCECYVMELGKVFLATTALEEFWDTSMPVVFLNTGCTRYSRRDRWGVLKHHVLTHPFKDQKRFDEAYSTVNEFVEAVLPSIARRMNHVHGMNASERYWRIILGLWLTQFVSILYERYTALRQALDQYSDCTSRVLDEADFITLEAGLNLGMAALGDLYNLQLYSRIFKAMGKTYPAFRFEARKPGAARRGFKYKIKAVLAYIIRRLAQGCPVFIRYPFMPSMRDKIILSLLSGGRAVCDIETEDNIKNGEKNAEWRKQLANIDVPKVEFGRIFAEIWWQEIPRCYLESFKDLDQKAMATYRFTPAHIVTSVGLCYFETFKFWAASCSERGTKLYGMQHGGNYGLCSPNSVEHHERKINDVFYSWGWEGPQVRPMPATKYLGLKKIKNPGANAGILYSSKRMARYLIWIEHDRYYDDQEYFQDQKSFVDALPPNLKKELQLRLFKDDCGWDLQERWKDHDPSLVLEGWQETFQNSMQRRRLHVTDYPISTFVDSMAVNMPTVLFWPESRFKIRDEARPYMDRLRERGVLLDSPADAAALVASIYDDVELWWYEEKRQEAVRAFVNRFARTSDAGFEEWATELKSLN